MCSVDCTEGKLKLQAANRPMQPFSCQSVSPGTRRVWSVSRSGDTASMVSQSVKGHVYGQSVGQGIRRLWSVSRSGDNVYGQSVDQGTRLLWSVSRSEDTTSMVSQSVKGRDVSRPWDTTSMVSQPRAVIRAEW